MPPLLILSPSLLDQSFPRNKAESLRLSRCLGIIQELLEVSRACLTRTAAYQEIFDKFSWQRISEYPELLDIHRLLSNWILGTGDSFVDVNTTGVATDKHPIPEGFPVGQGAELWQEETGRLLEMHDRCQVNFFAGIACDKAFGGQEVGRFINPTDQRAFPLVGPETIGTLDDAFEMSGFPHDLHQKSVTISQAEKNLHLLGASSIEKQNGTSHYKAIFPGSRPWTLDANVDPIPDSFLRELVEITGRNFREVKSILLLGLNPSVRRCKIVPE